MDTLAALREGRAGPTTTQAQPPQPEWAPLDGLRALLQHAALQSPLPASPSKPAKPAKAVLRSDRTPGEAPARQAARPKTLAQSAARSSQSGAAAETAVPPRRPETKPPATPHRPPRLPPATAPALPKADRASPDPPAGPWSPPPPAVQPPRIAEPLRPKANPSAEEPAKPAGGSASTESRTPPGETRSAPPASLPRQPEPDGWFLYLVVPAEIRAVADLHGRPIALGAQEPAVAGAIKQALAAAGVTPIFVEDGSKDPLNRLVAREVVAAPFLVGRRLTTERTDIAATLSRLDLRLLEIPLDLPKSR